MSIITFYSYKGGVGRSMAMANIAVLMAQRGLKVLAVDWDLEAPGLERYFSYFEQSSISGGLLPFFTEVYDKLKNNSPLPNYQAHIWTINVNEKCSFALLPSGRDTHSSYATMLERFDWHSFFSVGGGDFIERLRTEWLATFDIVLIDSRTGMSDAGGICTIQMPDVLVAMFTANDQSMLGVFDIIQSAQRGRQRLAYDRMPLTVLPIASRFASFTELEKSSQWLDRFAEQFSGICDDWLLPWIPLRAMFERLKILQVGWFSFGERLAVVEQGVSDPSSIGFVLDRITDLLASDFKDLEAALGDIARRPADWKRRETAKRLQKTSTDSEDYIYDLYISYQSGGIVTEWVHIFVDNLVDWLSLELGYPVRVFFDNRDLTMGHSWSDQLEKVLKNSKLLLSIITPAYFASDFCRREWAIFEERERVAKTGPLIFPVLLRGGARIPNRVQLRQCLDASDIDFVSQNRNLSKEGYLLLEECTNSIVKMLKTVAPFDPSLNIVPDDEILKELHPHMPSEDAADGFTVFIIYAHNDNDSPDPGKRWLNRLLEHLQPLVLKDKVSAWSDTQIESGELWERSIRRQLLGAKAAVLLVSAALLASKYIRSSDLPVLLMDAMNQGVTVLPIILRPCLFNETTFKYPDPARGPQELSLSIFQSANPPSKPLNSMQEHEQDAVLLSVAQRVLRLAQTNPLAGLQQDNAETTSERGMLNNTPAVWSLPHSRNPFFTERTQVLDNLRRALNATGKAALSGMGGVGKTQTAVEYAYRYRSEYKAVLWVKADNEESLKADYAAIAAKLNLPEKDKIERDKVVFAVKRWLEGQVGWLLILDNADDLSLISDLVRREWGGHIILTTRAYATGGVSKIEIDEMTSEEGTLFLLRRAKLIGIDDELGVVTQSDRELGSEITREVGGLPLALDQAGALIEEMSGSLAEYLALYRREGAQLMADRSGKTADHEPVTITFSLAFGQVASANTAAADMLRACAFLAPEAIPEEIFVRGAGELGKNLSSTAGGGIPLMKIMGEAARFSLIRRNTKDGTIEIHRLVQQVLKDEMGEKTRQLWAERVVRALNESFPEVEHKNWPLCEKFLPHAQEAARLIEEYNFDFIEAANLLNLTGKYCYARAQYAEAEPLFERSLSIREKSLGPDHPDVASSLHNLAALYQNRGRYAESEQLYMRSLSIREKVLGPDHPDVAWSLNNLAVLYDSQGKYTESEQLYMQALSIREKVLGPDHPDVATSLNNLAALYDSQGKYAEVEPLYARALAIYEKAYGPDHPDVALSLNNLGALYNRQGKYAEAEPLFERSLSIREKSLGPDHPDIALSLNNLGFLYNWQGRYAEAEQLYMRSLSIREKSLGHDHPDVAMSLHLLGFLYNNEGRYTEAKPLLARALSIYEKSLGPDHPTSSIIRENYTKLLRQM